MSHQLCVFCCPVCPPSLQATADLRAAGKSEKEVERFSVLFKEVQQQIDAKQLRPFIRTQYMRTAFQVGGNRGRQAGRGRGTLQDQP